MPTQEAIMTLFSAITAGAIFSVRGYLKKHPYGETFDWAKFISTAGIGAVLSTGAILAGNPLSQVELEMQILMYAGLIAIIEGLVKSVARELEERGYTERTRSRRIR